MAMLSMSRAEVSGVKNARLDADETRPKNMKLPFIIKVKDVEQDTPVGVIVATLPVPGQEMNG